MKKSVKYEIYNERLRITFNLSSCISMLVHVNFILIQLELTWECLNTSFNLSGIYSISNWAKQLNIFLFCFVFTQSCIPTSIIWYLLFLFVSQFVDKIWAIALLTDTQLGSRDNRCNHVYKLLSQHLFWQMCLLIFREARSNLHQVTMYSVCIIRHGDILNTEDHIKGIVVGHYQTSMERHVRWDPCDISSLTAGNSVRDAFILQNVVQFE